jgi:O-antigen ligase/Flp pilus assembly protein TadD
LPLLAGFTQGWPAIGGLTHPFPPILYRLNFTLNGATPLSAYLALLIPPALAVLLTGHKRDDRQAIAAWLALAVVVEILTFSRGGVLALLVSLPLTALGWWLARPRGGPVAAARRWLGMVRWPVIVAPLMAVLVLAALLGPPWLARTFDRTASTQFRFTLWDVALHSFQEHPLTGVGPYNFGRSLLQRNDPLLPRRQIMTAHNVYLNTAAQTGAIGLLAGAWLLAAAGRAWLVRWRKAPDSAARLQVAATGAALAGLAAQSLVDTFAATPNVLPVLAIAAFVLTEETEAKQVPATTHSGAAGRPGRKLAAPPVAAIAMLGLLLYAVGLAWIDVGHSNYERSMRLAAQEKPVDAALAAERAHRLDPALPLYTFQLAYVKGMGYGEPASLAEAAAAYRAGLEAEPVDGRQTANLAAVLWQAGDRAGAIRALSQAIMVEPNPVWLVNLGYFYEQTGDVDRAVATYADALALAPGLAGSQFWQAHATRSARWPDILAGAEAARAAQGGDTAYWRLGVALSREDWPTAGQQAQAILEDTPDDCGALAALARARLEAGSATQARDLAQRAVDRQPACGSIYVVRGLAAAAAADLGAAERDWRTALFLNEREAGYYLGRLYQARGDEDAAARFYLSAMSPTFVPIDVEVALYDRRATFDQLPPLFRVGVGPAQAAPWLALAELREDQGDWEAARRVYAALLMEDPFLTDVQGRMKALSNQP